MADTDAYSTCLSQNDSDLCRGELASSEMRATRTEKGGRSEERKDEAARKTTFTECPDWPTAVIMNEYTSRGRGVRADGDSSIRTSAFGGQERSPQNRTRDFCRSLHPAE